MHDDGARFHVISHMIRETVNCGKSILVTSIIGRDESTDSGSNAKETGTLHNLIQKDRVCAAVGTKFYFSAFPLLLIQFTLYCYWCTSSYIFQILLNNNTIKPVSYVFLQNWLQKTCCLAGVMLFSDIHKNWSMKNVEVLFIMLRISYFQTLVKSSMGG